MKKLFVLMLLALSPLARGDAVSEAYNAGAAYGSSNKSQGTSAATDTSPSSIIPGYTANPSQSSYYGGVQGSDGGIADKGLTGLTNNEAAQTATESATQNPAVTIDPTADFITNGKNAESNADTIVDGTNTQCTTNVVSKSTFENYTCDRDVNQIQTCARTGSVTGTYQDNYVTKTVTFDSNSMTFVSGVNTYALTVPAGTVISATLSYTFDVGSAEGRYDYMLNLQLLGVTFPMYNSSGNTTVATEQEIKEGEKLNLTIGTRNNEGAEVAGTRMRSAKIAGKRRFILTLTIRTGERTYVPSTSWTESCGFDKSTAIASAGTVCTEEGGTKTITVDGATYSQTSDCWQYSDAYVVPVESSGNCAALMADSNCTVSATSCTESEAGYCLHQTDTYQCQTTYTSTGLLCGGQYFCQSGDCSETDGAGDSGFDTAVAKLAGLASAAEDVKTDQINVTAFTGQAMYCRKAMAGFSNCCVDSGWGNSAGLANCNSDEMAIGKAKEKKVTVLVGEACNHKVLGVCIQKKQAYCVFGGKLARIIQEQGRRDQLGVSFGSGESPDCRGITVPELQSINFDLINFQDFYSELMDNQTIPDTSTMVQLAKERIAAQVNAQGGSN